jgi:hypothetical protein
MSLTLNLITTTIAAPPSNARKWQMGFNLAFKGLINKDIRCSVNVFNLGCMKVEEVFISPHP